VNRLQKFITSMVPQSWAKSMEADSRAWKLICGHCGHMESFWGIGGIRWKAKGNQKNYRRCAACGQLSWQTAEYRPEVPG
jgi:hypothetical protein